MGEWKEIYITMIVYYYAVFIISVVLSLIYAVIWQKHFDVQITIVFVLIPINNLGYLMLAQAENLDEAISATKILYLGGAFLIPFILFLVFDMCHLNRFMKYRVVALIVSMSSYFFVLTLGTLPLFYKKTTYNRIDGVCVLTKEYGILHTVFFVIVGIYFVMCLTAIIYSYIRKPNVSRHILRLMFFPAVVTLICYIIGRMGTLEFVPAGYVFAQIMYLLIIRRMLLYDITEYGVDALVNMNTTGFISFDRKLRYIGCNETAAEMFPFLGGLKVDYAVDHDPVMRETVLKWIEDFRDDETKNSVTYPYGERIYLVSINNLCFRGRKKGYQLFITDNTVDQKYIALLDGFNSELKEEVEKKTVGLEYMQNRVILGMAVMVESRDNSTGGHIRRTSDVMKVLTDEIMKDNTLGLSEQLCEKLVKAAPMH
ncbi:MAG: hypothetical protein J6X60_09640, partial [Ruminiclostridium sp.]|nr:hypothetical protein [Ruminiclostridium sp.]